MKGSAFDYQRLDDVIHSRIRLTAMAILSSVEEADFAFLKEKTGATDGNLGAHLRKLEDAGYAEASKTFVDRRPVTRYRLTPLGQEAFRHYIDRLERMLAGIPRGED